MINQPSPYQTGWLDKFLKCPEMIPLLETNRVVPIDVPIVHGVVLPFSKNKAIPLEQIKGDIEYIAGAFGWSESVDYL